LYVEDRALTAAQWLSVRAELIAKHGAEYPLPNLLEFLATPGCPKIKNQWDRCGVPNHHGRAALRIVFLNALNEMPTRRARRLGCKFIVVRLMVTFDVRHSVGNLSPEGTGFRGRFQHGQSRHTDRR
jgi:hypothetical protein